MLRHYVSLTLPDASNTSESNRSEGNRSGGNHQERHHRYCLCTMLMIFFSRFIPRVSRTTRDRDASWHTPALSLRQWFNDCSRDFCVLSTPWRYLFHYPWRMQTSAASTKAKETEATTESETTGNLAFRIFKSSCFSVTSLNMLRHYVSLTLPDASNTSGGNRSGGNRSGGNHQERHHR